MVLSGGGALGAYEVGVMKALALGASRSEPLEPEVFTGTSVGAFNAAFLATQGDVPFREAVARLEHVWLEVIANQGDGFGNGVFRYRLNPFELLNPRVVARYPARTLARFVDDVIDLSRQSFQRLAWFLQESDESVPERLAALFDFSVLVSMDPLEETLKTIDFERLRSSTKALTIAATKWGSGRLELADRHEMTSRRGPELVKGSVSIPGIFPPEKIGEDDLVDGGVLMNTPLVPAVAHGADVLHVVTLVPSRPLNTRRLLGSTMGAMNRAQGFSWDYLVDLALRNAGAFESLLDDLQELVESVEEGPQKESCLSLLERVRKVVIEDLGLLPGGRTVTIHRYRPKQYALSNPLCLLIFGREHVETLIAQGFTDASRHDCLESGCLTRSTVRNFTTVGKQLFHDRWNGDPT